MFPIFLLAQPDEGLLRRHAARPAPAAEGPVRRLPGALRRLRLPLFLCVLKTWRQRGDRLLSGKRRLCVGCRFDAAPSPGETALRFRE